MKLQLWVVLCLISMTFAYDILCIFPVPSKSHHYIGKGVVKALLKAGHSVTWVTAFPEKPEQNVTFIDVSELIPHLTALDMSEPSNKLNFSATNELSKTINRHVLHNDQLQRALVTKQYDAVITEWFFNNVYAGYPAVQQAPWIMLSGVMMHPLLEMLVDDVRSLSTVPFIVNNWPVPMNMMHRLGNFAVCLIMAFGFLPVHFENVREYETEFTPLAQARGVSLPPYKEALYNVSVMLVNSDPSFSHAQSLPPNVVDIGGYHIDEDTPPLPKDLQQLLDSSPQGVIYFSMGSILQPTSFSPQTRRGLLDVFRNLPYTVLWKFDEELLEDIPPNVHIRKWLPQTSVLAHPNIRLFITHGGLLSTIESLYFGRPVLAIPVFGDQHFNSDRVEASGFALKADFYGPNFVDEIQEKVTKLLGDESYQRKATELSAIFRNKPVSPRKLIVHYVELAIKTKGAYHLRSVTHHYAWYERFMLDAILFVFLVLYLIRFIIKTVYRTCCRKQDKIKTS